MRVIFFVLAMSWQMTASAQSFDPSHTAFTDVLNEHVEVYDAGLKSAVNYRELSENRLPLDNYLASLSAVELSEYESWTHEQQLAFLINAYNAFTLQLIIDNIDKFESGKADSIRNLGGLFSSPWEKSFFTLLGEKRTLDWVEHEKIRVDFDKPRIHAALVCAAVSCPKLRAEAFTGENLENQLENQIVTFLSDRDKNGIDDEGLYLSKIFDWYREDFDGLQDYLRTYSGALSDGSGNGDNKNFQSLDIRFVDYNWKLNNLENR
ncbi:DUF547 domain-containing protein [Idiomarina loihiensis]|uniref:DUF547 domain-containing protein n=1 Tax=Idiomarina loihiensis TaxID=135577 RepID=UPI00129CFF33|nr:DUF547 domain-containing protein [Idiomarina loihiensis]MRJ43361.1 DUF547 domain-containing protein [Idiomarina loihiensis]UTW31975.1 DUF547 domain-containing protein [Idiomarina loihiensis]